MTSLLRILPLPALALFLMTSCQPEESTLAAASPPAVAGPPQAAKKAHTLTSHGKARQDDYFWLRERDNPDVIAHLEAENAWLMERTAHTDTLQEELFEEIKGRIKQDDRSVPEKEGDWYYYSRFEPGQQYRIHCRRAAGEDGPTGAEQILLDVNQLAAGHDYYSASRLTVSPDGNLLCFAEDTRGRRIPTLRFKDLANDSMLADSISGTSGNAAWANDNRTLFYTIKDAGTLRSKSILRHKIGEPVAQDTLVFDETDETFYCSIRRSRSGSYLFINSSQTLSNEVRFLDADDPKGEWKMIQPRRRKLEYSVEHAGGFFLVRTNHQAENFRLMRTPTDDPGIRKWQEMIPHRPDVLLSGFQVFRDFLVLSERSNAQTRLRVMEWSGSNDHAVVFEEDAYVVRARGNRNFDSDTLRFSYQSMTTPPTIYDYRVADRSRELRKQDEVLGGFDSDNYRSERLWIEARDQTSVPVTLVYHKERAGGGPAPLLLYGYGSYGASMDPSFSATRLSLLDRGFIYAIAHVRGGQELGRAWYEDGKLLNKQNTFSDFIDVAQALIAQGRTSSDRLFAQGGSAGGLLMGAVLNQAPELWRGVVAQVPFVDVITTMEDDSIPLTTFEYDEWGNPADLAYFNTMMAYSPYDNVGAYDYPDILVTTGLEDSQVQYWEPAKWVARLRELKSGDGEVLFRCQMAAGHGGSSGRFRRYLETALVYAFLLDRVPPQS